ncbi:MAG: hypothetical protein ACPGOV_04790 [Magnetovibrionaceae bacterium]
MVFGLRFTTVQSVERIVNWLKAQTESDWDLYHDSLGEPAVEASLRILFSSKDDRDRFRDLFVIKDPGFSRQGWERLQEFTLAGGLARMPIQERRCLSERRAVRQGPGRRRWFAGSRPQPVAQAAYSSA